MSVQFIYDLNIDCKNEVGWEMGITGASFTIFTRSDKKNQIPDHRSFNIQTRPGTTASGNEVAQFLQKRISNMH